MSSTTITETTDKPTVVLEAPSVSQSGTSGKKVNKSLRQVIPHFTDKYSERQWAKERLAGAFRVFAKLGYNDGAGGHISLRDPVKPDCFWISK